MNLKSVFNSSLFLKSIFAASLFILIFISTFLYKHSVGLNESSKLLVHSHKVHLELEQLNSTLKDVEINQTGYFISRDTIFIKAFNDSRDKVAKSLKTLNYLVEDNLTQRNNLDILQQLITQRYNILFENSINLTDSIPLNAKRFNKSLVEGKKLMISIRTHINKMADLEQLYMVEREERYKNESFFTPFYSMLLLLFSLIVFVFSYFKINKDLESFKKANDELIIATESMKHAEEIGGFSSWQWNVQSNTFIYSDNQYRLLGAEPNSFVPSNEAFLEFVHPEDKHIIANGENKAVNDKESSVAFYRIIRKDGSIRYFRSIGRFLTNNKGNKILIGINNDITDQYLISKSLEDRNQELEKSNKELASFNHVASHDLQEPLRKIQTFISRIYEKESYNLSETGREYFQRIQAAANRMRILIDDLLLFSRTNKIEKVFEEADLNELLTSAELELVQTIEEKNAKINSTSLPTLSVIPFQIQQLFINLIANSLKYCKPDVDPIITIGCKIVKAKEFTFLNQNTNTEYYKITISDNGLGFEAEYAEAIFTLFYRLHNNSDYPGTGIGLAICKKIVENHKGKIFANGILGVGASFDIFLPIK
ncbi:CHASE3 domain-containing protein [Cytophaga aurantiaca]|uniref:CHASE3 domain-containing protein n=1 Tax=Cytophaga aurantiaca TaxID=29530 RepID=UPI0003664856|nr:CHASE3 domain-containing protein [Cytophaga aurantiaca]